MTRYGLVPLGDARELPASRFYCYHKTSHYAYFCRAILFSHI